jgi:MinD-like ATPase involved in chromosome partitioning or flagellar assembly
MTNMIFIHSFRGGTGKSNIAANLAAYLASQDKAVCLLDLDMQSPGIHAIFGFGTELPCRPLDEFLWKKCSIRECVADVGSDLGFKEGRLYLVPSSIKTSDITRILKEGYDFSLLKRGFDELVQSLNLDYLIIDTHPGVFEETLFAIAIADMLLIVMRPDVQDYQGTAVTVELSRKMGLNNIFLVANKIPNADEIQAFKEDLEQRYDCPVIESILHSDKVLRLGSKGLLYVIDPSSRFSSSISELGRWVQARKK